MVDPDVLSSKSRQVLHHCNRLEARKALTVAELCADEDIANSTLMDLQQAIQGCIDLATHTCVYDSLGSPNTASDAFALLETHGRISTTLREQLSGAAALRNFIVHQYTSVDYEIILNAIQYNLKDLRSFISSFH